MKILKTILKFILTLRRFVRLSILVNKPSALYLYGAGAIGVEILDYLNEKNTLKDTPFYWVDMRANNKGEYSLLGTSVFATSKLNDVKAGEMVVICSEATVSEMLNECIKQGVNTNQIVFW